MHFVFKVFCHFVFKVFCGYRLMIPATLKKRDEKSFLRLTGCWYYSICTCTPMYDDSKSLILLVLYHDFPSHLYCRYVERCVAVIL